jgi:hypothetical protein
MLQKRRLVISKQNVQLLFTIVIIFATSIIGILILDELSKEFGKSLDVAVSLIVGAIIASFLFYFQFRDEKKRAHILEEVRGIALEQDLLRNSFVKGTLIRVSTDIGDLRNQINSYLDRFAIGELENVGSMDQLEITKLCGTISEWKKDNVNFFSSKMNSINQDIIGIQSFIGDIYFETQTAMKYVEYCISDGGCPKSEEQREKYIKDYKANCEKALHQSDVLRDHIDAFLFKQLQPSDFSNIEHKIRPSVWSSCTIIVGSKRKYGLDKRGSPNKLDEGPWKFPKEDKEAADALLKAIKSKHKSAKCTIKMDREVEPIFENVKDNLILIGGETINILVKKISNRLPLQYVPINEWGIFYSRISAKTYADKGDVDQGIALVQAVPNPYGKNKVIILAYGLSRKGTQNAVGFVIQKVNDDSIEEFRNSMEISYHNEKTFYPARILKSRLGDNLEREGGWENIDYSCYPPEFIE